QEDCKSCPRARKAGQHYIVRSLKLAAQALQDFPALTSSETISRLARSTCCQRPNHAIRLSGALSVELAIPRSGTACPRNLCISYGRFRHAETNLSNLPQPITMCQSSSAQNAIFYRHAALLGRFDRHFVISRFPIL